MKNVININEFRQPKTETKSVDKFGKPLVPETMPVKNDEIEIKIKRKPEPEPPKAA